MRPAVVPSLDVSSVHVSSLFVRQFSKSCGCPCGCAFEWGWERYGYPAPADYPRCANCGYDSVIVTAQPSYHTQTEDDVQTREAAPKELVGIYSLAQWRSMARRLDSAARAPITDCCVGLCVVPGLVPLAVASAVDCCTGCFHREKGWYARYERWRVERVLAEENARLSLEGLQWRIGEVQRERFVIYASKWIALELQFNIDARRKFEAAHAHPGMRSLIAEHEAKRKAEQKKQANKKAAEAAALRHKADASRRAAEAESAKLTGAFLRAMELRDGGGAAPGRRGQVSGADAFSSIGSAAPAAELMQMPPPAYDAAAPASVSAAAFLDHCDRYGAPTALAPPAPVGVRRVGGLQIVHVYSAPAASAAQSDSSFDPPQKSWPAHTDEPTVAECPTLAPTVARMPTATDGTTADFDPHRGAEGEPGEDPCTRTQGRGGLPSTRDRRAAQWSWRWVRWCAPRILRPLRRKADR